MFPFEGRLVSASRLFKNMKIKLLTSRIVQGDGKFISQNYGETIDVADEEGEHLIALGQAEPVEQPKPKYRKTKSDIVDAE